MIITEIYNGQGLGNQLACYVTLRVVALDKGYDFGIASHHKFKCLDFMNLDFGLPVIGGEISAEGQPPISLPQNINYYYREKQTFHPRGNSTNIMLDDPALELVQDKTKLDGIFQSEQRIIHRKEEIKEWLKIKSEFECYDYSKEDVCIINFRGGDYMSQPDFFLRKEYWEDAINRMLEINRNFYFMVITDDVNTAKTFFPNFEVNHFSIAKDYSIIKNAKYLILSNSSFPYFPVLTSETIKYIIAPKYWGRHNVSDGYWSCGYNIFRNHNYIDRENNIFTFEQCIEEFEDYKIKNNHLWQQ